MNNTIIEAYNITKIYRNKNNFVRALNSVDIKIPFSTTIGLVGESGSGKTTLGKALLRLISIDEGKIFYYGKEVSESSEKEIRPFRKRLQIIFQDPFSSLNPKMKIYNILKEPLQIFFRDLKKKEIDEKIVQTIEKVGLSPEVLFRYPHQFSGGQRQRIMIARAMILEPEFIVCDEPVSALDVSIQAQILNLLKDFQKVNKVSYLFISHDLRVIWYMCEYVVIMYRGYIVEEGSAYEIINEPLHPYTQLLIDSLPENIHRQPHENIEEKEYYNSDDNFGCPYYFQCYKRKAECKENIELKEINGGRKIRCIYF